MTQDIDFQLETAFQRAEDWVVKSEGGREINRNKWKYYSMLTYSTLKKKKSMVRQIILHLGAGEGKMEGFLVDVFKNSLWP